MPVSNILHVLSKFDNEILTNLRKLTLEIALFKQKYQMNLKCSEIRLIHLCVYCYGISMTIIPVEF